MFDKTNIILQIFSKRIQKNAKAVLLMHCNITPCFKHMQIQKQNKTEHTETVPKAIVNPAEWLHLVMNALNKPK